MVEPTYEIYGHPYSSYTWKALIPFHALDIPFTFHKVMPGGDDLVSTASPLGKFPLLVNGNSVLFEATVIIGHLAATLPQAHCLIPADPAAAVEARMLDRVFDLSIQGRSFPVVAAYIASACRWKEEDARHHKDMGFEQGWGACADQLKALCEARTGRQAKAAALRSSW